jgi:hypothetical protein
MCSQRSIPGEGGNGLVTLWDSRHSWLCHHRSRKAQFLQGPPCWWFSQTCVGYMKTLVHSQSMCSISEQNFFRSSVFLNVFWIRTKCPNVSIQGRQPGHLEGALCNRYLSHVGTFSSLWLVKVPCTQNSKSASSRISNISLILILDLPFKVSMQYAFCFLVSRIMRIQWWLHKNVNKPKY